MRLYYLESSSPVNWELSPSYEQQRPVRSISSELLYRAVFDRLAKLAGERDPDLPPIIDLYRRAVRNESATWLDVFNRLTYNAAIGAASRRAPKHFASIMETPPRYIDSPRHYAGAYLLRHRRLLVKLLIFRVMADAQRLGMAQ